MEYRRFGRTGLKISAIGFGCWEIGGTYGRIDEAEFQRAVARAIDGGITCFDTAEAYGMGVSEEALARARSSASPRRCMRRRGCGTRNGPRTVRFSRRSKTAWRSRRFPAGAAGRCPAG